MAFLDEGAFLHQELPLAEQGPHLFENPLGEFVRLQQVTELEQGGGIGHGFHTQVDTRKEAHRLAVIDGVFERLVGQRIPLLEEVDAQHALDPDGRTAAPPRGIMGLNQRHQACPRHHPLHFPEELFPPRGLLLGGKFGLGETRLAEHGEAYQKAWCTIKRYRSVFSD